jgi:hypothetical protein
MDPELLEERAAIIAEGCGVSQEEGMRRAVALLPVDNLPEELSFG